MEFGIGVFLALVAVAVTVTPGATSATNAIVAWVITLLYGGWLINRHFTEVARFVADNKGWTTAAFVLVIAGVSLGVWRNFVIPLAVASAPSSELTQKTTNDPSTEAEKRQLYANLIARMDMANKSAGLRQDVHDQFVELDRVFNQMRPFFGDSLTIWRLEIEKFKGFIIQMSEDPMPRSDKLVTDRATDYFAYKQNFENGLATILFGAPVKPKMALTGEAKQSPQPKQDEPVTKNKTTGPNSPIVNQQGQNNIAQFGNNNSAIINPSTGWRTLTDEEIRRLVSDFGRYKNQTLAIKVSNEDTNKLQTAQQLADVFRAAGWTVTQNSITEMWAGTPETGLSLYVKEPATDVAAHFNGALRDIYGADNVFNAFDKGLESGVIGIIIRSKKFGK